MNKFLLLLFFIVNSLSAALAGKIENEWYTSPNKRFKVKIPHYRAFNQQIADVAKPTQASVIFWNDCGDTQKVCVDEMKNEILELLKNEETFLLCAKDVFETDLKFNENYFKVKSEIVENRCFYDERFGFLYFTILVFPKASRMMDVDSGKRNDAIIGNLISFDKNQLINISLELPPHLESMNAFLGIKDNDRPKKLLKEAMALRESVQIISQS